MFPTGSVGVALLILRTAVAAAIIVNAVAYSSLGISPWIIAGMVLCVVFLCLGVLTPYASAIVAIIQIWCFRRAGNDPFQFLTAIVGSGIVSVLGPGAYSIDSRIFGRKLLELPPKNHFDT